MFLTCQVGFCVGLTFYGLLFNMFLCCFESFWDLVVNIVGLGPVQT